MVLRRYREFIMAALRLSDEFDPSSLLRLERLASDVRDTLMLRKRRVRTHEMAGYAECGDDHSAATGLINACAPAGPLRVMARKDASCVLAEGQVLGDFVAPAGADPFDTSAMSPTPGLDLSDRLIFLDCVQELAPDSPADRVTASAADSKLFDLLEAIGSAERSVIAGFSHQVAETPAHKFDYVLSVLKGGCGAVKDGGGRGPSLRYDNAGLSDGGFVAFSRRASASAVLCRRPIVMLPVAVLVPLVGATRENYLIRRAAKLDCQVFLPVLFF